MSKQDEVEVEDERVLKRADDKFLRRMLWVLVAALISTGGGWAYTAGVQSEQIKANTEGLKEMRKLQETMQNINVGVIKLVESSLIRNEIMIQQKTQQDFIFGEQKRRLPVINRAIRHMDDRGLHK